MRLLLQLLAGLVCILPLASNSGQVARIIIKDDADTTLTFTRPVTRIVSLAPHITEILFAIGAGEKIVGTVDYSDFPEQAKQIPVVGSGFSLDVEKITSLKPDVVIAWKGGNPDKQVEQLKNLGIPVFENEPKTINDITRSMVNFSKLTGTEVVANLEVKQFNKRYKELKNIYSEKPAITVFYQIWHEPLMTVGGSHLISHVLEMCGAKNIFDDIDLAATKISLESVIKRDPEAIISSESETRADFNPLEHWQKWSELQAVKNNNLFLIPPSILQRSGPRILEGAEAVCQHVDAARSHHAGKEPPSGE